MHEIPLDDFLRAHAAGRVVLDIREPDDYAAGHIPGSMNIPSSELAERLGEIPDAGLIYLICAVGGKAQVWADLLEGAGIDAVSVERGIDGWIERGLPVVTGPRAY